MVKKWLVAIIIVIICMNLYDFMKITNFEKPMFSFYNVTADDGGSGQYYGFLYMVDLTVNTLEHEKHETDVVSYDYYLLGFKLSSDEIK